MADPKTFDTRTTTATPPPPPPLPNDVLIEILKRLPLKSLVRFTCICKSWFSLLTSQSFMSTLASYNSTKSQNFLLFKQPVDIHSKVYRTNFFVYDSDNLMLEFDVEFPFCSSQFVVSSADGLLCLYNFYDKHQNKTPLILWNPSINKYRMVHVPEFGIVDYTAGGFPKLIFGFGFDSSSSSYKVVRVMYFKHRKTAIIGTDLLIMMHSISDGEWNCLEMTCIPHCITTIRWRGMCLNGVIHWICNLNVNLDTDPNDRIYRMILTVSLKNGKSGEIMLPKELVDMPDQSLRVVMVPRYGKEVLGVIHIRDYIFSLWVMEYYGVKESWVKLFSVDFHDRIKNDMNVMVISDHLVVVKTMRDGWLSYDHNLQQIQSLEPKLPHNIDYVDTYVESLFLVGTHKGVLQGYPSVKPDYKKVIISHKGKSLSV